jgi:hypothetical protein
MHNIVVAVPGGSQLVHCTGISIHILPALDGKIAVK